ncbi:tRNA pseudouridine(65) synthase TruC [Mariprofundus sp. EBB-1]|uniref:tRNA pseudouridine(65) synthase TruC n=1 Tax=Mariprofundus sp. EBB-1 TaxID=2650971 RepID=UPI000EF22B76|nr:tRNA pseudouridine(65) synthase TruC [Mariprofundus sp. EBB-1]RLL52255.1 tRNA pseudouridine(65) synthase TruC [Mariprofundus sp. EBB-1]
MLDILYQDDWLIAINKPSGLLVHRSMIDRYETRFAVQMLRDQIGQHVFPVHRLDKPTSGVLLFALNSETARKMGELFSAGVVCKEYLAVVRGYTEEQGIIDYPLKEELDKKSDRKARQDKEAQEAVTAYRRLATVELPYAVGRYQTARYSLVHLMPKTGRKHQLRRHLKHVFHPIVGDTTHGDGKQNQFFRDQFNTHRLLLHANRLRFVHPETACAVDIHAPLQGDFADVMSAIGLGDAVSG